MKRFLFLLVFLFSLNLFCQEWKIAYLASYPRSGNHWIRFLVEEAVGIATSSVYPDEDHFHFKKPFPWGGFSTDHGYEGNCRYPTLKDVALIKTHYPALGSQSGDKKQYTQAIRIIRHPIDSFFSLYVYYLAGPLEKNPIIPRAKIERYINSWEKFQKYWDQMPNTITIRYEDLLNDPAPHLRNILRKLGYRFTEKDIQRAVAKYPPSGGVTIKNAHHYLKEDLSLIESRLSELMNKYGYEILAIKEWKS